VSEISTRFHRRGSLGGSPWSRILLDFGGEKGCFRQLSLRLVG
jgi:hypothetical protein